MQIKKNPLPPHLALVSCHWIPVPHWFFSPSLLPLMCSSWNSLTRVRLWTWDAGDPVAPPQTGASWHFHQQGQRPKVTIPLLSGRRHLNASCFQPRDIRGRASVSSDVDPFSNPCHLNSAAYFAFVILILLRRRWFSVANAENKMSIVLEWKRYWDWKNPCAHLKEAFQ